MKFHVYLKDIIICKYTKYHNSNLTIQEVMQGLPDIQYHSLLKFNISPYDFPALNHKYLLYL